MCPPPDLSESPEASVQEGSGSHGKACEVIAARRRGRVMHTRCRGSSVFGVIHRDFSLRGLHRASPSSSMEGIVLSGQIDGLFLCFSVLCFVFVIRRGDLQND